MGETKRKGYAMAASGKLARLRVKHSGLTCEQAATRIKRAYAYLRNIEAGLARAGDATVLALARLYGLPAETVANAHRSDLRRAWLKKAAA